MDPRGGSRWPESEAKAVLSAPIVVAPPFTAVMRQFPARVGREDRLGGLEREFVEIERERGFRERICRERERERDRKIKKGTSSSQIS